MLLGQGFRFQKDRHSPASQVPSAPYSYLSVTKFRCVENCNCIKLHNHSIDTTHSCSCRLRLKLICRGDFEEEQLQMVSESEETPDGGLNTLPSPSSSDGWKSRIFIPTLLAGLSRPLSLLLSLFLYIPIHLFPPQKKW